MFWGHSDVMQRMRMVVERVSATDANVLITGENGTGKDMLAREIHRLSARSCKPMVVVDMGAITESLFESELFGHVKGSFTNAYTDRVGRFEAADGGTLFLDEIANLPYYLQSKLLTAIQKRSFVRVGSNVEQPTDIRLICATNRNLDEMVRKGEFREDLLYRINTIHLHLPALRERRDDICAFAGMFVEQYSRQYGRGTVRIADKVSRMLTDYSWPGNIRELKNCIESSVVLAKGNIIQLEDLPPQVTQKEGEAKSSITINLPTTMEDAEKKIILSTIEYCAGNKSRASELLDIGRKTLHRKLNEYMGKTDGT